MIVSSHIYCWVRGWKNFENRSTNGNVIAKSKVSCFFHSLGTNYTHTRILGFVQPAQFFTVEAGSSLSPYENLWKLPQRELSLSYGSTNNVKALKEKINNTAQMCKPCTFRWTMRQSGWQGMLQTQTHHKTDWYQFYVHVHRAALFPSVRQAARDPSLTATPDAPWQVVVDSFHLWTVSPPRCVR